MTKIIRLLTKNNTQKQVDRTEAANDLRNMADQIEAGEVNNALLVYEINDVTQLLPLLGSAQWMVYALEAAKTVVLRVAEEAVE